MALKDYTTEIGNTYGKLTITGIFRKKGRVYAKTLCDCGNEYVVRLCNLTSGNTKSCGCLIPVRKPIHGLVNSTEYSSWENMLQRCYNKNNNRFSHYGEKGIVVYDEWKKFENFYADMGPRPEGTSLDRIDNNGNYEPGNCRWATRTQQMRNTSRTKMLTYNGVTKCLSAWAEDIGIGESGLHNRLRKLSVEEAFTRPIKRRKNKT